jgi:hypothetical protein
MSIDINLAKSFIDGIDLTGTPRGIRRQSAKLEASAEYDAAKAQSQVVGSGIFSFTPGVSKEVRKNVSNALLLAQLVAKKKVAADPRAWLEAYSNALESTVWTLRGDKAVDYTLSGNKVEVHKMIFDVMLAALGPGATTLIIVKAAIEALKSMDKESSWLTIFNRETRRTDYSQFLFGIVENGDDETILTQVFFTLHAETDEVQVLFVKVSSKEALLSLGRKDHAVDHATLSELAPRILKQVRDYRFDYIGSCLNTGPG